MSEADVNNEGAAQPGKAPAKSRLLGSDAPATDTPEGESLYWVDGKAVSLDTYLKAAEAAGWNPVTMQEQNSYPAIGTKKHGE